MRIVRFARPPGVTWGVAYLGRLALATLELPDLGNAPSISCIPAGRYWCERKISPTHGETFEVLGVPGRSHILFHKGNRARDSRGCILIGMGWSEILREPSITQSAIGFEKFLRHFEGVNRFLLTIEEAGCIEEP